MMRHSLHLLGAPALLGPDGAPVTGRAAHRHRIALLALLTTAPRLTLSRDKLMACLWPEADERRARHLLNVAVHVIRKSLGESVLISEGDDLRLDADALSVDLVRFVSAAERDELEAAVAAYGGPFLDGFHLNGSPEFEKWLDGERASLDGLHQSSLERLAAAAEGRADWTAAVAWRRRLAAAAPYTTRHVLALMEALERAGDRGGALQLAAEHEALLRDELGAEPDPALLDLVRRLRESPHGDWRPERVGPSPEVGAPAAPADRVAGEIPPDRRRPLRRSALAAGVVALAALTLLVSSGLDRGPDAAPGRVVVAPFENRTADESLRPLERAAADWVAGAIVRSDLVEVVDPTTAYQSFPMDEPRREALRSLSRATRAGTLVTGAYQRSGDSLYFVGYITDAADGRILAAAEPIAVSSAEPNPGLDAVASRLVGGLARILDPRFASLAPEEGQPPTYEAYREFVAGLDLFTRGEYEAAGDIFLQGFTTDSAFNFALLWAAYAFEHGAEFRRADSVIARLETRGARLTQLEQRGVDWFRALRRGDRLATYRAAREAMKLAPRSNWAFDFARAALRRNRPREALEALRGLDPDPGWVNGWTGVRREAARAHHLLGEHEPELRLATAGAREAADMMLQLEPRASALAALGREAELNRLIDELLALPEQPNLTPGSLMHRAARELRAHGYGDAADRMLDRALAWWEPQALAIADPAVYRWVTVSLLYRAGRLDEARARVEEWWGERADRAFWLQELLGLLAARRGDREEAERYMRLLAAPAPRLNAYDASGRIYGRALIAARLGDRQRTVELLREALAEGLPFGIDSVHVGPDLEPLRGYPPFDQLVRLEDDEEAPERVARGP